MASFVYQKSRISALQAQLASVSRKLEESVASCEPDAARENEREAERFLEEQDKRQRNIEQGLLAVTDQLLPTADDDDGGRTQMTMQEMMHLLGSIQDRQTERFVKLQRKLGMTRDDDSGEQQVRISMGRSPHWTVGRPLEAVVETDNETDGSITTPGSFLSAASPRYTRRTDSITPDTPIMPESMLLQHQPRSHSLERARSQQETLNPFGMIQHEQQPTFFTRDAVLGPQSRDEGLSQTRQEQLVQLEEIYHGSNGNHNENDKDAASTQRDNSYTYTEKRFFHTRQCSDGDAEEGTNDEGEEDTYDDSAAYCATVVAKKKTASGEFLQQKESPYIPPSENPNLNHIVVDHAMPSPAPTNLTMDTMMTDTLSDTPFGRPQLDESMSHVSIGSEETPVLDRYRLDEDDESPNGFVVVPNPRGQHRQRLKATASAVAYNSYGKNQISRHTSAFSSPSTSKSDQPKRAFRTTPLRKKSPSPEATNENVPLQEPKSHWSNSTEPQSNDTTTSRSPLRTVASSLDFAGAAEPTGENRRHTLPAKLADGSSSPRSSNSHRASSAHPSRDFSSLSSKAKSDDISRDRCCIRPVTEVEYNAASRSIQSQVTLEKIEVATAALNNAFASGGGILVRQFYESEAHRVLHRLGFTERDSKSVLLSLCHWRRLFLRRESASGTANNHSDKEKQGFVFTIPNP